MNFGIGYASSAWFAHTPAVAGDADRKAAARASAESRYRDLMQFVVRRFASRHRFLDDLPQERVANDAELDAVLARAAAKASEDAAQTPAQAVCPQEVCGRPSPR